METYLIPCLLGLEKLVSDEVKRLGLQEVQAENGRILCRGTLADAARLNLNLRCGARVLLVLGRFPARSFEELFQATRAIAWEDYLPENAAFPVNNFGAIIRTSEAALVDAIIIPQDREVQVNSTVMKTSAGALAKMNICRVTNLVQTINKLKDDGFWIVGTAMDGTDYRQIDYSGKIALVVGNEGNGMSRLVRESCDFVASIPMRGEINSLNASVATGIMIYEVVRKRK